MPGHESQMSPAPDFGRNTYRGSDKLAGKVAFITGGDSGIGRAIAYCFASEGCDVAIGYLSEDTDAQETKAAVEERGRTCVLVKGDISDEAFCQQEIEQVSNKFGRIDLLINNAAYQMSRDSIADISAEELDTTFRINLFAMFYLCKAALPHMSAGSAIINTASIQAYQPSPNLTAYAATKAAIVNFTKSLSQECIQKGIRVNAVAPGPVWTPLIPATLPEDKVKEFGANTGLNRAAQPVEVAPVFVFLASEEASYVTGQIYGVTGGQGWP